MSVRDSHGKELKCVLLQIKERDRSTGVPRILVVRRDDEKIDLTETNDPAFLTVWVHLDQKLGEVELAKMVADFQALKEQAAANDIERKSIKNAIASVERDLTKLQDECDLKTEELRKLQRERDPERQKQTISAAVLVATETSDKLLKDLTANLADRDREIVELRASKRKLKEANERLKNGGAV